jgi:hydrogenase maturation protease
MNYLVIGYGNLLRSDDGVGQLVAEEVENWGLSHVRSRALHQLTPELVDDIAKSEVVIFVDAIAAHLKLTSDITLEPVESNETEIIIGHKSDPQSLIVFAKALYGKTPIAYQILIPGVNFSFGEKLSPIAQAGWKIALNQIKEFVCHSSIFV